MNRTVSMIGSAIVTVTVFLFAVFIISGFNAGQYFVCALLPVGFIMMNAGFHHESEPDRRVPANVGMVLAAVYAVLVLLVYFSQNTYVRLEDVPEDLKGMIVFEPGSLAFSYDLLGYGMMALSTLFIGLSMKPKNKPDKWLRNLTVIHGAFFPGCFIMPMTGVFSATEKSEGMGGNIALLVWCIYFIPIGVLAYLHFSKQRDNDY